MKYVFCAALLFAGLPAAADTIRYDYQGERIYCDDVQYECELGPSVDGIAGSFWVDDTKMGNGNLLYDVEAGGREFGPLAPDAGWIRTIEYRDIGVTETAECRGDECGRIYQYPEFIVDPGILRELSRLQYSTGHQDDSAYEFIEFTDWDITNWRVGSDTNGECYFRAINNSGQRNCWYNAPYDILGSQWNYTYASKAPGTWTRTNESNPSPVPLPAPLAMLLVGLAIPFGLRMKARA